MKSPAPRIPTTPQIEADRAREERLLEIEEEQLVKKARTEISPFTVFASPVNAL